MQEAAGKMVWKWPWWVVKVPNSLPDPDEYEYLPSEKHKGSHVLRMRAPVIRRGNLRRTH